MKKLMSIVFIGCMGIFSACNSGTTAEDTVDSAKDANDSMMSNDTSNLNPAAPVTQEDANWSTEVANAGMTEVELSKLAQTKATSQRVKDFANMMVADHTKANDQLKQLAATKNITLPAGLSNDSQDNLDKLNKKSGSDFDKAYVDMMLDDHKKAVDKFQKASNDLKDPDLKNFVAQTLPTLQMHLDSIKAIAGKK